LPAQIPFTRAHQTPFACAHPFHCTLQTQSPTQILFTVHIKPHLPVQMLFTVQIKPHLPVQIPFTRAHQTPFACADSFHCTHQTQSPTQIMSTVHIKPNLLLRLCSLYISNPIACADSVQTCSSNPIRLRRFRSTCTSNPIRLRRFCSPSTSNPLICALAGPSKLLPLLAAT